MTLTSVKGQVNRQIHTSNLHTGGFWIGGPNGCSGQAANSKVAYCDDSGHS